MSKDTVIKVMRGVDDPFVTLPEITAETDYSKSTVHSRLEELNDDGEVHRKQVGGRAVVWWLPESDPSRGYSDINS